MTTRFRSLDDLIPDAAARTGVRRDELVTLAEIGALNSFGYDRRTALWQIEWAVKKNGELLKTTDDKRPATGEKPKGPLPSMTPIERVTADYQGTGLTIGPHPMTFRRSELAVRGVLRAIDLRRVRDGRRVRVAGAVITRQRPGTAKGFVFLTLEDETGVANIIVRPDLFTAERMTILEQPFLSQVSCFSVWWRADCRSKTESCRSRPTGARDCGLLVPTWSRTIFTRTYLINHGEAPRASRCPSCQAREGRIPAVCDRRATPRDGMHRRPNAGVIYEIGSRNS